MECSYCYKRFFFRIIISSLELCDLAVSLCPKDVQDMEGVLNVATEIYLENYPPLNLPCRNLMCSVLSSKSAYYEHRVSLRKLEAVLMCSENTWLFQPLNGFISLP
jgi:hypothetical protein